jgi:tRNA-Thr(GGU) m(6)t(6)A37 methyltransferase TsaA
LKVEDKAATVGVMKGMKRAGRAEIVYRPIGIIRSEYRDKEDTPIQAAFSSSEGEVEIFPEYAPGLKDVESFSHLILLYHFHHATGCDLLKRPFLDDAERGIFATRHFNRPNPIGISIVELLEVKGNVLKVRGLDVLDGTLLLDVKPYVREFDLRENAKSGWLEGKRIEVGSGLTPRRLGDGGRGS